LRGGGQLRADELQKALYRVRVVLSWFLFARFGLNAVAAATGIGWLLANIFWAAWRRAPTVRW